MTLINGDKIVTAQLYDDEHEEFTEKKMSIIDYVNAYTNEGVTTADDVLDKIRAEIDAIYKEDMECDGCSDMGMVLDIIDKYKAESQKGGKG